MRTIISDGNLEMNRRTKPGGERAGTALFWPQGAKSTHNIARQGRGVSGVFAFHQKMNEDNPLRAMVRWTW